MEKESSRLIMGEMAQSLYIVCAFSPFFVFICVIVSFRWTAFVSYTVVCKQYWACVVGAPFGSNRGMRVS